MTFAKRVIDFNEQLRYTGPDLPSGIRIMNPFLEFPHVKAISAMFYNKYYDDHASRHLILGINPSRLGAGLTGIPFTDPKRLIGNCNIPYHGRMAHEPSSVFIYEMIDAYGGSQSFYKHFFINSPCPLGFTSIDKQGKETNYNYYDSSELMTTVRPFMIESIRRLINLGIKTDICFCFGTGKNEKILSRINREYKFFGEIIALEHPRFIMQYKNRSKATYIQKYLNAFSKVII